MVQAGFSVLNPTSSLRFLGLIWFYFIFCFILEFFLTVIRLEKRVQGENLELNAFSLRICCRIERVVFGLLRWEAPSCSNS